MPGPGLSDGMQLHLDPAFAPAPTPAAPAVSPMGIPPLSIAPPPGPLQIPGATPNLNLTPAMAMELFGNYAADNPRSPDFLRTPPTTGAGASAGSASGFGLNAAGLGITTRGWQIGFTPSMSTSDRYDNHQNEERARRADEDAREAQRRGDKAPNPIGDMLGTSRR